MEHSIEIEKSQNITTSSTRSIRLNKSSYKISQKYKPTLSDDFYTKKKVHPIQVQAKLRQVSAKKIQNFFKLLKQKKKLKLLLKLQRRGKKPLLQYFSILSKYCLKVLSFYFKSLKPAVKVNKSLTFDISNLKIKPELLDKLKSDDKGMISYICDEMVNETQTFIKDPNESHTFLKVFNEENDHFQVKEFGNFEEMNFSRFDFMEIELPEFITSDFNPSLWKKDKLVERVSQLQGKIVKLNESLLKELVIREELQYETEILKNIIKKLINIKRFN